MGRTAKFLILNFSFLIPLAARGQEVGDTAWLHEVVITSQPTTRPLGTEAMPMRIVTRDDIERLAPTSIEELLQAALPDISFDYAMDQQSTVSIQGLGGGAVLFLVDGERMAGESLDNIDYSRLVLADIERIEVTKGSVPAQYGAGAAGAVVNIVTRQAEADALRANAQWGADHLGRYSAVGTLRHGRVGSATAAEYYRRSAVHLADAGELTTLYPTAHFNLRQRITYTPTERLRLGARANYYFRQRSPDPTQDDRYRDFGAGLRAEWQASEADHWEASYSFDEYHKSRYLTAPGLDLLTYSNVQHALRTLYTHHRMGDALALSAGAEVMRDYLLSYQFADGESHRQHTASAFAEAEWWPVGAIEVQGALRFDHYSAAGVSRLSPQVAMKYHPGPFTLRATLASGFRAPSLKEMYMDFDMAGIFNIYGNPDLRAETMRSITLGADYAKGQLSLGASAYLTWADNRIATVWSAARQGMVYQNAGRMRLVGVDLTASYRWECGLGLRASYTFTHQHSDADAPQIGVSRPHAASVQMDYSHVWNNRRTSVSLGGRMLSRVKAAALADMANPTQMENTTYPGYMLCKLTVRQELCQAVEVSLTVDNLLNYVPDYYYNTSPATKGITLLVGVGCRL